MKKVALIFSFLSAFTCLRSQDLILNFDHNSSFPYDASIGHLENNLQYLKTCDSLLLVGHTDTTGSQYFNEELSKRRVDWIYGYLLEHDVKVICRLDWKGESDVLNSRNDSLNRRVMLYAYHEVVEVPTKKAETFLVDNSRDTMILGKENTVIILPAHSLVSGSPGGSGKFDVYLTEYYSLEDILQNKVTTQTPTDLLVSEGMINLQVYEDGISCTVDPGNPISIGIPVGENSNENTELFYGEPDDNGNIIWKDNDTDGWQQANTIGYRRDWMYVRSRGGWATVFTRAKLQGDGNDEFIRYIREQIDYSQFEVDSSKSTIIRIEMYVDPLGFICKPVVLVDSMPELQAKIQAIVEYSPPLEPFKSGKHRYGATVLISFPLLENILGAGNSMLTINSLSYKLFPAVDLQWINFDYYAFKGKGKTDFIISTEGMGNISNNIIFADVKSVMSTSYFKRDADNDKTYFKYPAIPADEDVSVILIKNVGEKMFFASKQVNTSEKDCVVDDFKEVSEEDLEKELSKLSEAF